MRNYIYAGAASLALAAVPLMANAQDMDMNDSTTMQSDMEMYSMNAQQKAMYDGMTAENRTTYDSMGSAMQEYYWTLDNTQRDAWWVLTNDQRGQLFGLAPTQRAAAWESISRQMSAMNGTSPAASGMAGNDAGMANGSSAMGNNAMGNTATTSNMGASSMTSGNIRFVSTARVQPTPADAGPPTGDLPLCTPNAEDNCINPYEATGKGPKPLDYWPGKPASEMN